MVAFVAEKVLGPSGFVNDAQNLAYVEQNGKIVATFSRRFDGILSNERNPQAVWEIKEYYGTTTFGSRVADGVYETLLDGFEIEKVTIDTGHRIAHYLFVDDRFTWWDCGKSYLCRLIDMMHTGHVDEIFFGRQVVTEWEQTLREVIGVK